MKLTDRFRFYITYILPLIVAAVYLRGYWDFFAKRPMPFRIAMMAVACAFLCLVVYLVFWRDKSEN